MPQNIQQTRERFTGRIGEIIEAALGIKELSALFEAAEKGDLEAQAKITAAGITGEAPSGMLALKMGLVTKDVKNALLTAQAAEKILQLTESTQENIETMNNLYDGYLNFTFDTIDEAMSYMPDKPAADLKNPTFKFIGSKDDPETLICAQATYYLASIFFNEITQNGVSKPRIKEDASIYLDGFKAAAAQSYRDAADILGAEGHDALSDEMLDVAEQISFNDEKAFNHTPKNYTGKLIDFSNAWQKDLDMDLNVLALRGEQSIIDYNVSILKILPKPKWGFRP